MIGLSFGTQHGGYLAQGGDIGSLVARILALEYDDCKGENTRSYDLYPTLTRSI